MEQSVVMMGSIVEFSGCRRIWSASRKKRLTVAPSSMMAHDDIAVVGHRLLLHNHVVAIVDAGLDHGLAAHREHEGGGIADDTVGSVMVSVMFSSARIGEPAATLPTKGTLTSLL